MGFDPYQVTISGKTFTLLLLFDPSEDYDWLACGLYQRQEDGKYFMYFDSGRSCTSYGDELNDEAELIPVESPHASVELVKQNYGDKDAVEYARQLLF